MKPLIERLLTPRKEPAPYPDGWHDVVDPDKREAAEVIQQQRALLAECERAFNIIAGHEQCLDNLMGNRDVAEAMLARLRAQEKVDE